MLRVIAEVISTGISTNRQHQPAKYTINFVKVWEKAKQHKCQAGGLLGTAKEWQLKVDLRRQLKFPDPITVTMLRPDIFLVSETAKQAVRLELTTPWKDQIEEAFERKVDKYEGLASERSDAEALQSSHSSANCVTGEPSAASQTWQRTLLDGC